jgi:hypothetical protein
MKRCCALGMRARHVVHLPFQCFASGVYIALFPPSRSVDRDRWTHSMFSEKYLPDATRIHSVRLRSFACTNPINCSSDVSLSFISIRTNLRLIIYLLKGARLSEFAQPVLDEKAVRRVNLSHRNTSSVLYTDSYLVVTLAWCHCVRHAAGDGISEF